MLTWRKTNKTPQATPQEVTITQPVRWATVRTKEETITVTLRPLSSSLIEMVGHDGNLRLVLFFRTLPNQAPIIQTYCGVTPALFQQLIDAESPGKFYSAFIWNRYPSLPGTVIG